MTEQIKSKKQLNDEIFYLRQQNEALSAELAFHREMFRQVHQALGAAKEMTDTMQGNEALRQLAKENEKLRSLLKLARLSEREREIVKYIVHGLTSKEIAQKLNISKLTVDTHRKRIQQKLKVDNMVELLKIALYVDLK
ncbi:MAG TPA: LuxR family transcriptional regulator [Bacteroidetes bacterium]|nr:LuxR family transcriptional regulator [Bacteroidota bacterium]